MLRQPRSGRTRHPERRARRHRFHRARHLHDRGVHHGDEGARRVAGADAGRRQEHPQGLRRRRPLDPRLRDREGAPRVRPPHRLDQDVLQGGRAHRHGHRRRHAAQPARRERARAGIYVRDRHLEPRFAVLLDGERRRPDAACRPGQGQGRQQRRLRGVRRRSSGRHQACRAQGEPPHGGETRHRRQGQPRGVRPASQPRRRRIAAGRAGRGGSVDEILLILLGIAWALGTPILAIVALVRTSRLRSQNDLLRADLAALQRQMAEGAVLPPPFEVPAAEIVPPPAPPFELEPAPEPAQVAEVAPPPLPAPFPEPVPVGWEQRLGARAFLWIGAITLALAAVFLVRYSIEEGYLSPEVRVILAALFGFALIGGAEKMRARDERVAQALAAAGVASLYGALFAAVALYEMISKVAAGGGAAAFTAFAIGLSLRHGMLVASLAFVGGFVSPAIIGSDPPNTPVLFGYLLAIAAGTLSVIRARGWWPACSCGRHGGAWARAKIHPPTSRLSSGQPLVSPACCWWPRSSRMREGRASAGWRWRRTVRAFTCSPAGLYASSTSRHWRRSCRSQHLRCGGAPRASRAAAGTPIASPGPRFCSAGSTPPAPSRCCGTPPGRAFGQRSPSPPRSLIFFSAGTCCAASRPPHRGA